VDDNRQRGIDVLKGKHRLFVLTIAGAILIQVAILTLTFVLPAFSDIRTMDGRSAFERSARLSFGDRFYEYVEFIRETIPYDARVVLPPITIDAAYGNLGIMQYFLAPREISNCPSATESRACLETFSGENTYLLFVRNFPYKEDYEGIRELVLYNNSLGVIAPPE
jgi:hypothetical protein